MGNKKRLNPETGEIEAFISNTRIYPSQVSYIAIIHQSSYWLLIDAFLLALENLSKAIYFIGLCFNRGDNFDIFGNRSDNLQE